MARRYDHVYMLDLARPSASKIIRWFHARLAASSETADAI